MDKIVIHFTYLKQIIVKLLDIALTSSSIMTITCAYSQDKIAKRHFKTGRKNEKQIKMLVL